MFDQVVEKVKELEEEIQTHIKSIEIWREEYRKAMTRVKELEKGISEIYSVMNQYPMATYSLRMTIQKVFKLVEKKKD